MNIIITGASSGIGFETALLFAKDPSNKVIAVSRNANKLGKLKNLANTENLITLAFDISSDKHQEDLLPYILKEFNTVDILINNAGLLINKPFEELTIKDFETVYRVNVFGVMNIIQTLLPMMGKPSTHIVNIGSIGGVGGTQKFKGLSAYSSSKGALAILTECLAEEFQGRNISVNCLALGSVQTEMLGQAFPGYNAQVNPEEMAKYIVEFASRANHFMNGKIIQVSKSNP